MTEILANTKSFTDGERQQALERAGYMCERCGRDIFHGYHLHHKKPRSLLKKSEGSGGVGNAAVLCVVCHDEIHADIGGNREWFLHSWEEINATE